MLIIKRYKFLYIATAIIASIIIACDSDGNFSNNNSVSTAAVDSIEIMILESFPVQVNVIARGFLPDGCTEIGDISQEREGNFFTVTIFTTRDDELICTLALVPFEETIALDVFGLPAGVYTVMVNDVAGAFELEIDNLPDSMNAL